MQYWQRILTGLALALLGSPVLAAGMLPTPARAAGEADGPYPLLVIRGATIIAGNGGPPYGPADIIIRQGRIAEIRSAGTPGLPLQPDRKPCGTAREIDATGMDVMPGFVDLHGHNGDAEKANDPSYAYRPCLSAMAGAWRHHGARGIVFRR